MNRNDFNYIIEKFPKGSVKAACYIVREYIRHEMRNDLIHCAVSKEEYDEAVKVLLAYSFQTSSQDTFAEQWLCDGDCDRNNGLYGFCPGEFQNTSNVKKLCKYYIDSQYK